MIKIRKATEKETLEQIKALYKKAFPRSERKPWSLMIKKQAQGTMEILSIEEEDGGFLGLSIFAFDKDLALLDYFAISEDRRGQGVGSKAIRLLQQRYEEKRFVLEIESTKHEAKDLAMRKSRKEFYLRNGLHPMDFDVKLFGVEMEILANCEQLSFEEYLGIYLHACGSAYSKCIFLINTKERSDKK